MAATTHSEEADIADALAAEDKWRQAVGASDWPTTASLIYDDFTYTHPTGRTDDKPAYLNALTQRGRSIERGETKVRLFGDTAVITGNLDVEYAPLEDGVASKSSLLVIRVWVRQQGTWLFAAFQATKAA